MRLSAGSGVKLEEHVGHQVSVTGEFIGGAGSAGADSSGAAAASESASSGDRGRGSRGTFLVSSVSMISTSCPADR